MHYRKDKLSEFIIGSLDEFERNNIEQHIYNCNLCMDMYLKLIDKNKCDYEKYLPDDFSDKVMEKINEIEINYNKTRISKKGNLIFYYAVASIITILLTFTGAFQLASEKVIIVSKDINTKNIKKTIEQNKINLANIKNEYIRKLKIDDFLDIKE